MQFTANFVNHQPTISSQRIHRATKRTKLKILLLTIKYYAEITPIVIKWGIAKATSVYCGITIFLLEGMIRMWYRLNDSRFVRALADFFEALDCIVFNFKDWCPDKSFRTGFSFMSVMIYAVGILSGLFLGGRLSGIL